MNYEKNIRDTAKIIFLLTGVFLVAKTFIAFMYLPSSYGSDYLLKTALVSYVFNVFTLVYGIKQARLYEEPLFYIEPIPAIVTPIIVWSTIFSSTSISKIIYLITLAITALICFAICKKHQGK